MPLLTLFVLHALAPNLASYTPESL